MKYPFRTFAILTLILAILSMFLFYFTFQPDESPKPSPQKADKVSMTIDKARYTPGETVSFSLHSEKLNNQELADITYYHLNHIIKKEEVPVKNNKANWKWSPPEMTFKATSPSQKLEACKLRSE